MANGSGKEAVQLSKDPRFFIWSGGDGAWMKGGSIPSFAHIIPGYDFNVLIQYARAIAEP
jgi:hypothetical protein